ncbi:MAG: hypothetical protein ACYDHA_11330 [Bellilinea sp.]
MSDQVLVSGVLVKLTSPGKTGLVGIVTKAISQSTPGYILFLENGILQGMQATIDDVVVSDQSTAGFAQLAYNLIKFGSHVIEKQLIV